MGAACSSDVALPTTMTQKEYIGDAVFTSGKVDANGRVESRTSKGRRILVWRTGDTMRYVFTGIVGQPAETNQIINHGVVITERHMQFRNAKFMSIENWHLQDDGSIRSVYNTLENSWITVFRPVT